jgi:integrase
VEIHEDAAAVRRKNTCHKVCDGEGGKRAGEGNTAYLSRKTVRLLTIWLQRAGIKDGALFGRLVGRHQVGEPLNVNAIVQAFKRVATFIGMTPKEVAQISGHTIRVGATQDLLALNIDLGSVMQEGRGRRTECRCAMASMYSPLAAAWPGLRKHRAGIRSAGLRIPFQKSPTR